MVNFNNETIVGIPAADIERLLICQRRSDVLEALEDYKKRRFQGSNTNLSIVRARLITYFLEIQALFKRRTTPTEYKDFWTKIKESQSETDIYDMVMTLSELLDKIGLIKVDTKKVINTADTEAENREEGL